MPVGCADSSDCQADGSQACIQNLCEDPQQPGAFCDVGSDCASGSCGQSNRCICNIDQDCAAGFVCVNTESGNECVSPNEIGGLCQEDSDCAGSLLCDTGHSNCVQCLANLDCQLIGSTTCIHGLCSRQANIRESCDDTSDCEGLLSCDPTLEVCGECFNDSDYCLGSDTCIELQCSPVQQRYGPCDADIDCDTGLACSSADCYTCRNPECFINSECDVGEACIGLACRPLSGLGGPCDEASDCTPAPIDCAPDNLCGSVLAGCSPNRDDLCDSAAGLICLGGVDTCLPIGTRGSVCLETSDCGIDLDCFCTTPACDFLTCDGADGSPCVINADCGNVCIDNVCSPLSSQGGGCDDSTDCVDTLVCINEACRFPDGAACSSNGQCENTCIDNLCAPFSGLNGACEETADCQAQMVCSGTTCLFDDGASCTSNVECANVCINTFCALQSSFGGPCDEMLDCQSGLGCNGVQCLDQDNEECTTNSECVNTCLPGSPDICGPLSGFSDICNDDADCVSGQGLACDVSGTETCLLKNGEDCSPNNDGDCVGTCVGGSMSESFRSRRRL